MKVLNVLAGILALTEGQHPDLCVMCQATTGHALSSRNLSVEEDAVFSSARFGACADFNPINRACANSLICIKIFCRPSTPSRKVIFLRPRKRRDSVKNNTTSSSKRVWHLNSKSVY